MEKKLRKQIDSSLTYMATLKGRLESTITGLENTIVTTTAEHLLIEDKIKEMNDAVQAAKKMLGAFD